jgi:hypothetical protein
MGGWKGLRGVLPAAAMCGAAFAGTQFLVSDYMGPQLTDILASLAAMGALLIVIRRRGAPPQKHSGREIALAWAPYLLLVIFVLLWGYLPLQAQLNAFKVRVNRPGLHNAIQRTPSRGNQGDTVWCRLQLHLALGVWHGLPAGGNPRRHGSRPFDRAVRARVAAYRQATGAGGTYAGGSAWPGLPDELLGRDGDARSRLRGDRRTVSVP